MARCEECKANNVCDHNRFGFENCGNFIPTDVVLQSEIERLTRICHSYALQYGTVTDQQKVIDKAKAEVAREIFNDLKANQVPYVSEDDAVFFCIKSKTFKRLKKKYVI